MSRYFRRGTSKIMVVPTVAADDPTDAELSAGVDISDHIADISGFSLTNNPITTPDLATTFDSQIEGNDTTDASSFTLYDDDDTETVRTLLAKGTENVIVLMPYGRVPAKRLETWRVRSTGANDQWSMSAEAAKFVVGLAILETPNQDSVVPATVP